MSTACFARALPRCPGRLYMGFRFILQAVRPIGNTRNPFSDSSWGLAGRRVHRKHTIHPYTDQFSMRVYLSCTTISSNVRSSLKTASHSPVAFEQ